MNKILQGDALEKLKELPSKSVNCIMTSPPYWALRDYGTSNWEGGSVECDHKLPETEKDPKNPDANAHAFRFIRESCYKCGAKRIDLQLGLEPTFQEYINKLCDIFDECKRVLRKDGTCWVNLGDTYSNNSSYSSLGRQGFEKIEGMINHKVIEEKSLCNIPARFSIEMQNRGWILRNVIIWHKPNCMPSSVTDRFTVDFEYLFFFVRSQKYWFETQYEPSIWFKKDKRALTGGSTKSGKSVTDEGNQYSINKSGSFNQTSKGNRNKRAVWTITTKPFKEAHFATYPEELCETPIKAGCPKDGIVLDPFFGAGTTGLVALKQNKRFIGIELNPEYIEIAKKRLKPYLEQTNLFSFQTVNATESFIMESGRTK